MNLWPIEKWIMRHVPGMGIWRRRYLAWCALRAAALIGVGVVLGRVL